MHQGQRQALRFQGFRDVLAEAVPEQRYESLSTRINP
jgi:hypothetical protein